ncbi:LysR family transcriptional regulator [Roseomonas sp. F4]
MNSEDLRLFLRVAEAGSLSRAATVLRRPKSSISRQLARLEDEAGARLLERGREGVRLTDAGRVLLAHAAQVAALIDGAAAAVQAALETPQGVLRVNAPHLFATHFLAPHLPAFLAAHPGVKLVLDVSPVPVGAAAAETDVMIRVGPLEDSSLLARRIGTSELRLYVTPAALGGLAPEEAAARLRVSGIAEDAPLGQYRNVIAFEAGTPVQRIEVLDPIIRHGLVTAGAGAAWLPAFLCRSAAERGELLDLMPDAPRGPIALHAVFPPEGSKSPKLRVFLDFLTSLDVLGNRDGGPSRQDR